MNTSKYELMHEDQGQQSKNKLTQSSQPQESQIQEYNN